MSFVSAFLFERLPAKFATLRISTSTISLCSDEYVFSPGVVTPGRESFIQHFEQVRRSGSSVSSDGKSSVSLDSPSSFDDMQQLATSRRS